MFTSRIFNIVQRADLLVENKIKEAIGHNTIKQYAYILHDKDIYVPFDRENEQEALQAFYTNATEVNLRAADYVESDIKLKSKLAHIMVDGTEQFVLQDRVNLSEADFIEKYNKIIAGTLKTPHWQIVIRTDKAIEPKVIAKWLGIPQHLIECPKGRGAFLDCVEYLTHSSATEQARGKHLYDDAEVIANFDWKAELQKTKKQVEKYGKKLTLKEQIRMLVLEDGWTVKQVQNAYPVEFAADISTLKTLRGEYLTSKIQMPLLRLNYYISGAAGAGKGLLTKGLAKALYKQFKFGDSDDIQEMVFTVGAKKASFDGYDGQPIIIWEDFRAINLLEALGDRGNVFRVFDTFPSEKRARQNIKYGTINLCNVVNIVNGIDDYTKFLDELSGEYTRSDGTLAQSEDKDQSYRRFQFNVIVYEDSYDLMCNKGFFMGTREYQQYIKYSGIVANFRAIQERSKGHSQVTTCLINKAVEPITINTKMLIDKHSQPSEETAEEILANFSDCGTINGMTAEQYFTEPVFDSEPFNETDFENWLESEAGKKQLNEMEQHWIDQDEAEEIERLAKAEQLAIPLLTDCGEYKPYKYG